MDRHPALMDPRTPLPAPEARPARLVPWSFVWMGVLTLLVAGGLAWVLLNPGHLTTLNVNAPAATGGGDDPKKDRAVAIAYVDVEQGVSHLYPVRMGRVVKVHVKEGDDVEKGQPLIEVDDSLAQEQLAEAELALEGAKVRKEQAENLVAQQQDAVRAQERKIAISKNQVAVAEANLAKARRAYQDRLGGLAEDVGIAEATIKTAKSAVEAENAELDRIKGMATSAKTAVKAADVEIKAKERLIKKAKLELTNYVLLAPRKGKILRSFINVGEAIGSNAQRPALEFAPAGELVVRAEIEQEFASHVRVGMKAKIADYDASNEHVWDGQVTELSAWISKRRSQVFEPMQFNDVRTLEAVIKLKEDPKYPLRIGQRVRVTLEW